MNIDFSYSILGLVQGLTEFLPVSSSGHIKLIGDKLMSLSPNEELAVNVILHAGTLLSLLIFFRRELLQYLQGFWQWLKKPSRQLNEIQREIFLIFVLSIPTGIIGLALKKANVEEMPVYAVLIALCITAILNILTDRTKPQNEKMNLKKALIMGIVQGCAVLPGISRSGSTIFTGVSLGISREKMASFSFLMSIPAISGAFLLEIIKFAHHGLGNIHLPSLLTGTLMAFLIGYASLILLVHLLKKKSFKFFGFYCFIFVISYILTQGF
jgi:undecaprenyl-diphosphatase